MTKPSPLLKHLTILSLLVIALDLRFVLLIPLETNQPALVKLVVSLAILTIGGFYVFKGSADVIEETTEDLSEKTRLASGFLQSIGTAFPDMVLGVTAATISLQFRSTNYPLAIQFAIIAAATAFGSNIYNIGYAIWCLFRQNLANIVQKKIPLFPFVERAGFVKPTRQHSLLPSPREIDTATDVLIALTILTALVAVGMVVFGRIPHPPLYIQGDLYQLVRPIGLVVLFLSLAIIYYFRQAKRPVNSTDQITTAETFYRSQPSLIVFIHLLLTALTILLTAESMVYAIQAFAQITGLSLVISSVLTGFVACLGEILVIHKYTVSPNGRLGDAFVGIAMDNILTLLGAAVIAIMGGIFLGGNSLILIFVTTLTLNSILIWQIGHLKDFLYTKKSYSR